MLALIQKKMKALERKTVTFMVDVKDFPHPTLDSAEQLENYDEQASKIEAELSAFNIDNMGKTIEDNRNYKDDTERKQGNIEDLQTIFGQMRDKHRTLLVPICSKSFKLVELERCGLSQHINPGFWTFITETQKQIKEHPHMDDIWLNKLNKAIKESEPLEFRKFNIYPPTTVQGFWQKLESY